MTLARSTDGGATWTRTAVHRALSDPNHQRWFSGATNGKTTFFYAPSPDRGPMRLLRRGGPSGPAPLSTVRDCYRAAGPVPG
jgi:hypothetical protein